MNKTNHQKKLTKEKTNNLIQVKTRKGESMANIILIYLTIIILFIESVYILIKGIKRGIFRKEVLTQKSKLGFDIIIKG